MDTELEGTLRRTIDKLSRRVAERDTEIQALKCKLTVATLGNQEEMNALREKRVKAREAMQTAAIYIESMDCRCEPRDPSMEPCTRCMVLEPLKEALKA